ncbi:hypothetical protein [Escherichia coli]|uniref:hypothetical protein n=1 Tax=Escherichia coli TaxID=562 RepID=UPI002410B78E|nr:hypothetical protein [Escherichia coli]
MTGADFLLPIAAGAAISWASYSVVAHAVSKQHISTLRATVWGALGTLSLVLGVCAFSAVGAEHQTARKDIVCADDNPECYAKTHHNPVRECKKVMDEKAKIIQAFGQQAKVVNSLGMLAPLQYFCVFNAKTGEVIAASFE